MSDCCGNNQQKKANDSSCCGGEDGKMVLILSLIHISEPTRLGMISYAVFC